LIREAADTWGELRIRQEGGIVVNLKEIKEMIRLMDENNLVEFEIEKNGLKLRLKKESKGEITTHVERIVPAAAPKEEIPMVAREAPRNVVEVKAPMVGTFYRAPAPDAPPFVEVGSVIEEGEVLCIIEAMKLMNEIKSEIKGKIVEIPVENGEPIEFGQVLFVVEPAP
jgi:oxaloacetate decarboxylase alpha subunit